MMSRFRHVSARIARFAILTTAIAVTLGACSGEPNQTPTGFSIAITSGPITIAPGASSVVHYTITPLNGFNKSVHVSASANGISADAADVDLSGGQPVNGTLTVTALTGAANNVGTLLVSAAYVYSDEFATETATVPLTILSSGSFAMSIASDQYVLTPNRAVHVPVSFTRAQFTGAISLAVTGLPTGTTASITQPGSSSTADIALTTTSATPHGPATITVTATAPGAPTQTGHIGAQVEGPGFALSVAPTTVTLAAGSSVPLTLTVARDPGFTSVVSLIDLSDPGLLVTIGSVPADQSVFQSTLAIDPNLPPGHYVAHIAATGTIDMATRSVTVNVTVTPAVTNTSATFCASSGLPLWFARQDGAGPWTAITGSNNVYSFNIGSGSGGVAYVTRIGGITDLHVFYGTQQELAAFGASLCALGTKGTNTATGSVTNTGTASVAVVGMADGVAALSRPATSNFSLSFLRDGALDLIGSTATGNQGSRAPLRMALRRGVAAGALQPLDFTGSESFVPATGFIFGLANTLNQFVNIRYLLHTANFPQTEYFEDGISQSVWPLFGLPSAMLQAGDVHYAQADAYAGTGDLRSVGVMFGALANQQATFGPSLNAPAVSVVDAINNLRPKAVLTTQPEYQKLFEADFQQSTGSDHNAIVQMTNGYAGGAATVTLLVPDFSSTTGWTISYGLTPGFLTQWTVMAKTWSGQGILGPLYAAGTTSASATKAGTLAQ